MSAFFLRHPKETDLALFAGGESGPLSRWRVERHIESCSECKAAVSDFFHLSEQLQPLADLPDLNWDAMALGIERRLAAEEGVQERRLAMPAMAWAASLAAVAVICGVVVVRQQQPAAPADNALMETVAGVSDSDAPAELESEARMRPGEAASALAPAAETKAKSLKPAAPAAAEPEQIARLEKREPAASARTEPALADQMAPAPPPAPLGMAAGSAVSAQANAPRSSVVARARQAAPRPSVASAEAFSGGRLALEIQPIYNPASDVRIAADGWISVRSTSADGRVTITDVYAP